MDNTIHINRTGFVRNCKDDSTVLHIYIKAICHGVITEFRLKLAAVALAVLTPLLMILCYGPLPSISKYWETEWQPLFILSNAVTSYFFFTLPKWKLPAVFLMLLTAFSVQEYQYIHNLFAIAFFLSSYRVLWSSKRYPVFLLQYGVGIIVMPFSFLWGEVISISALSLYHLTVLIRLQQLTNR